MIFGAGTAVQAAGEDTFTTGRDWVEKMSSKEKFISIVAPLILFTRYGVPFHHTPPEYIDMIDRILYYNPYLEHEDVANIFASTMYAYEPESRPALENMERELRYQRGAEDKFWPYLTLRSRPPQIPQETVE